MIDSILGFNVTKLFEDSALEAIPELGAYFAKVDWLMLIKIASLISLVLIQMGVLLLANDAIFEHYTKRRIKTHHLTVRNNGNLPSYYLFRTVDLPKQLAIRFRVGGNPMIWVSERDDSETDDDTEKKVETVKDLEAAAERKESSEEALIPNLKNPGQAVGSAREAVDSATKTINKAGRKVGLLAGIISSVSNLLPKKVGILNDSQAVLKGVQQEATGVVGTVNSKMGSAETLKNQVGSLVPQNLQKEAAESEVLNKMTVGGNGSAAADTETKAAKGTGVLNSNRFFYDEEIWHQNIGKKNKEGGALNLVQSKILEPGESMKLDLEILSMSENPGAASYFYKIEAIQMPQSSLPYNPHRQLINGVVTYQKFSQMDQILPLLLIFSLIIVGVLLLAGYSHLIF